MREPLPTSGPSTLWVPRLGPRSSLSLGLVPPLPSCPIAALKLPSRPVDAATSFPPRHLLGLSHFVSNHFRVLTDPFLSQRGFLLISAQRLRASLCDPVGSEATGMVRLVSLCPVCSPGLLRRLCPGAFLFVPLVKLCGRPGPVPYGLLTQWSYLSGFCSGSFFFLFF